MSSQGWRHFPFARVVGFVDGDTCKVEVDQGFGGKQDVLVRIFGISAPDTNRTEEREIAKISTKSAQSLFDPGVACELSTWRQSFTRYVGIVVISGRDAALDLLQLGVARAWDVKKPRPVFTEFPIKAVEPEVEEYLSIVRRDFLK